MRVSNHSAVPVYTISGSATSRPLPEWLARKRKRSLKNDAEYASRIELLQDFEFEEASQCIRISDDGQWVMSTGLRYQCLWKLAPVNNSPQGPTSLKSTHITCPICPCRFRAILCHSTRPSFSSHPTTPSRFIFSLIALSNFTHPRVAITQLDCLDMGGI